MVTVKDIKAALVKITEAVKIPYCELWVNSGGGLLIHGLRETTQDIDAGCCSHYFHRIAIHYGLPIRGLPRRGDMPAVRYISIPSLKIDIFEENIAGIFKLILVNDVWVYDLPSLLKQKRMLNRPKDHGDIDALVHALGTVKHGVESREKN